MIRLLVAMALLGLGGRALATVAQALDDLRRLGYLDYEVNGWPQTPAKSAP